MSAARDTLARAYAAVLAHVQACGEFRIVNGHEPKSSARHGPAAAVWADYLGPAVGNGLAETSALFVVSTRTYMPMVTSSREQADAMDPALLTATAAVMDRLIGDLTLGGLVRTIDVRGISGRRLEARAGYFEQDRTMFRALVMQVPMIINDVWTEAP